MKKKDKELVEGCKEMAAESLKIAEEFLPLDTEVLEKIEKAEEDFRKGRVHTLEEVKKRLQESKMKELWNNKEDEDLDAV